MILTNMDVYATGVIINCIFTFAKERGKKAVW